MLNDTEFSTRDGPRGIEFNLSFLNPSWIFWNWFSNLIKFKGTKDPTSTGKVGMGEEGW